MRRQNIAANQSKFFNLLWITKTKKTFPQSKGLQILLCYFLLNSLKSLSVRVFVLSNCKSSDILSKSSRE